MKTCAAFCDFVASLPTAYSLVFIFMSVGELRMQIDRDNLMVGDVKSTSGLTTVDARDSDKHRLQAAGGFLDGHDLTCNSIQTLYPL